MQLRLFCLGLRLRLGVCSVLGFAHSPHLHLSSITSREPISTSYRLSMDSLYIFIVYVV
nr:MAG TPA: hypothetical protein [Siphoviridae sp. ctqtA1]